MLSKLGLAQTARKWRTGATIAALFWMPHLALRAPAASETGLCFDFAAHREHVNPEVLMAIAWHESHFWPWRIHINTDGSTDYGLMQINSRNLQSLGLTARSVMPPCANILAGARLYRRAVQRYGNTWAAVGAYHSKTPVLQQRYAQDIAVIFAKIIWVESEVNALARFVD